jgi:serine protease Do
MLRLGCFPIQLILLMLASVSAQAGGPDHRVSNSVVQIRGVASDQRHYFGSGVVVAPKTIATNCHVVRSGGTLGVYRGYRSYVVTAMKVNVQRDLCLLHVPDLDFHPARIARLKTVQAGEQLFFYGFPRALGMSYTDGKVISVSRKNGIPLIETSAFFTLGGSGGGLFDVQGRLVGLATFISKGHGGGYYAISSELIAEVSRQPLVAVAPLEGAAFWEQWLAPQKPPLPPR